MQFSLLTQPYTGDAPDAQPVLGFGFCSTRGRRQANEDRVMLAPRIHGNNQLNLYGIFDGHAGPRASGAPAGVRVRCEQRVYLLTTSTYCSDNHAHFIQEQK